MLAVLLVVAGLVALALAAAGTRAAVWAYMCRRQPGYRHPPVRGRAKGDEWRTLCQRVDEEYGATHLEPLSPCELARVVADQLHLPYKLRERGRVVVYLEGHPSARYMRSGTIVDVRDDEEYSSPPWARGRHWSQAPAAGMEWR